MKTYFRIISIVLAFAFLSGCEKPQEGQSQGKDPDPIVNPDPLDPAARVVRVITEYTAGGHSVSDICYDSKGRMSKLTGGMFLGTDGVCNIEYNDASNTATAKFDGESIVMELDESGRCVNDGHWRYTYFGGHLVSSQSINGSSTWSYSWDNDCLTDIGHKTKATREITYDSHDNPFYGQSYDPFCSIDQGAFTEAMCLCFCAMSSKKLYKSYFGTDFSYTFSEDGRLKEAMMSYDGVPQAIFYASYSDETPRQPRDEKTESLPSYLKGDWIITGRVEDGSEIPGLELFGWSFTVPGTERQLETSLNIYRLQEGSLQTLPIEVNGNNAKYFNGVLSGVIGEPYDVDHMKDNIVYKSDHLHLVGYDGEWKEGLKVTKINDNTFYCKGFEHDSNTYVYEKVTELSEAKDEPEEIFQPGFIIIGHDPQNNICNLMIFEQGLGFDEKTGALTGTGKALYLILQPSGDISHTGGEDELADGTYLSSDSSIKAESMIFMSREDADKMSGKSISNASLTITHTSKNNRFYYSGTFAFTANGKKYSGSFSDLLNSGVKEDPGNTEITPGSIYIFNDVKNGICNLAILEQGLTLDSKTGQLSGTGKTVHFILQSNSGGEDDMAAGMYLSSNSTIKSESVIFLSKEDFDKMSGVSITDATLNVTRETKDEQFHYSGYFEFNAGGKKYSGGFNDLVNSVKKESLDPEPVPELVTIALNVKNSGGTKASLASDGFFNLSQGDMVYVNGSHTMIFEQENQLFVTVPFSENGYDIVYYGTSPMSASYDGSTTKYYVDMPYNTTGEATPICMGYTTTSVCELNIMTGLLSISLEEGMNVASIELSDTKYLSGTYCFSLTNYDYQNCSISAFESNKSEIIIGTAQSSLRTFYFNIIPGTYNFTIKAKNEKGEVLVSKTMTGEHVVERAHLYNLGTLQTNK